MRLRLDELTDKLDEQLHATLKSLRDSATPESLQTVAAYQRRQQDEKQKTLDVRNRTLIASRVLGADNDYLKKQDQTKSKKESNPFVNQRDLANINNLFRKLNDTINKLDVFKQRAKELPDLELVQKKLNQFGAALGFVEEDLAKKDEKMRE